MFWRYWAVELFWTCQFNTCCMAAGSSSSWEMRLPEATWLCNWACCAVRTANWLTNESGREVKATRISGQVSSSGCFEVHDIAQHRVDGAEQVG